jgi:hypothetical protein
MDRWKLLVAALALRLSGAATAWFLPSGYADDAKGAPPRHEETVAAKRYKTWVFVEGGRSGVWIEELFFPEKGVCANVERRVVTKDKTFDFTHVLNAFHSPIRNKFTTRFASDELSESSVEDVQVPAALARSIFEAADLHRRLEAARSDIGPKLSAPALLRDLDENGKPRADTPNPATK